MASWREGEANRQRVNRYVDVLLEEPAAADVAWLASLTGDLPRARHELRLLRCAMGVLVAEQDALADRTAADVVRQLGLPIRVGQPERREGWARRWREYAEASSRRGTSDVVSHRLARVLFSSAGHRAPAAEDVLAAAVRIADLRTALNEALRSIVGQVRLPDDIQPSAIGR